MTCNTYEDEIQDPVKVVQMPWGELGGQAPADVPAREMDSSHPHGIELGHTDPLLHTGVRGRGQLRGHGGDLLLGPSGRWGHQEAYRQPRRQGGDGDQTL